MKTILAKKLVCGGAIPVVLLTIYAAKSGAFPQYSANGDATYCGACHGDFRSNSYISPSDGQNWGNLHNIHRFDMLGGDCLTCHVTPGSTPVATNSSGGGIGFDPIGCIGCHGRTEDAGPGAGLRQHHWNAGITLCSGCHPDANPANYTPVGEDVLPPYYFTPDPNHPSKPTDPCSPSGGEDYAGSLEGLDNDGDDSYDGDDPDCSTVLLGDMNCDGFVDVNDIPNFLIALLDPASFPPNCDMLNGDFDTSGDMSGADLQGFVDVLID